MGLGLFIRDSLHHILGNVFGSLFYREKEVLNYNFFYNVKDVKYY